MQAGLNFLFPIPGRVCGTVKMSRNARSTQTRGLGLESLPARLGESTGIGGRVKIKRKKT